VLRALATGALAATLVSVSAPGAHAGGVAEGPEAVRPDPAARLLDGDDASEVWLLQAVFDDRSLLLARVLLTNIGPGRRNAVATGVWVAPDGTPHGFDNVRRRDE